jgi:hypothetical protein
MDGEILLKDNLDFIVKKSVLLQNNSMCTHQTKYMQGQNILFLSQLKAYTGQVLIILINLD